MKFQSLTSKTYHVHHFRRLKTLNETMQLELDKISNWLVVNKLSFNTSQTRFIVFKSSKKNKNYNVKISLNNANIEQVKKNYIFGCKY
jgi:hypothetical protein